MSQYAMFPMKNINISQREFGSFSHQGVAAIDLTGKDSGIESAIAPCDLKVVFKNGTNVIFESLKPVITAKKGTTYINIQMYHDNNTNNLFVGDTFKQGQVIYQEGTAGNATGAHIHTVVAVGKYAGQIEVSTNRWTLKNQAYSHEIYFIDNTYNVINTKGNTYATKEDDIMIINLREKRYLLKGYSSVGYFRDSGRTLYNDPRRDPSSICKDENGRDIKFSNNKNNLVKILSPYGFKFGNSVHVMVHATYIRPSDKKEFTGWVVINYGGQDYADFESVYNNTFIHQYK